MRVVLNKDFVAQKGDAYSNRLAIEEIEGAENGFLSLF